VSLETLKDEQRQQAEALVKERALPGPIGETIIPGGVHTISLNGEGPGWSDIYKKTPS